jgi:hypothetical protein
MIAACLAFRNAARYLREWLLFHMAAGVDRFYLYDNESDDDCQAVLAPFLKARARAGGVPLVELVAWPGYFQQNAIYDDCLRRARGQAEWVAFIDDDEFLHVADGSPLGAFLAPLKEQAGVAVCWQLYGSSHQLYAGDEWVIRRFTRRAAAPDRHVKCIVRPAAVARALVGGHQFETTGAPVVDENLRPIFEPFARQPTAQRVRLNHYLIKSMEELAVRRTSRDIGTGDRAKLPLAEWIRLDRNWNAVVDESALQFQQRMAELAREF